MSLAMVAAVIMMSGGSALAAPPHNASNQEPPQAFYLQCDFRLETRYQNGKELESEQTREINESYLFEVGSKFIKDVNYVTAPFVIKQLNSHKIYAISEGIIGKNSKQGDEYKDRTILEINRINRKSELTRYKETKISKSSHCTAYNFEKRKFDIQCYTPIIASKFGDCRLEKPKF